VALVTAPPPPSPPAGSCLIHRPPDPGWHWQRADHGYRTCSPCCNRLHHWLSPRSIDPDGRPDGVPALYALLNPRPVRAPGRGGGKIRRLRPGSRSPANDHVVAMRDARTVHLLPGDPRSAPATLQAWVLYVWETHYDNDALDRPDYLTRLRELPTRVDSAAAWLDQQLDWLTRQEIITEFHDELRALHSALRSAGTRRRPVGPCPLCGVALFVPLYGDMITCWTPGCGKWARAQWLALGDAQGGS
jgi:hypothetical protein